MKCAKCGTVADHRNPLVAAGPGGSKAPRPMICQRCFNAKD